MRRLPRFAAALALLAVPLTSCTPTPPTFTGVRTASIDGSTVWTPTGDDWDLRTLRTAVLDGPHYTLGLSYISTGTTLDDDDARKLGIASMRAPKGSELVVAEVDPTAFYAAYGGGHVDVSVTVGGSATPIQGLPIPPQSNPSYAAHTTVILVSAPRGAPLRLRATDAGRTDELDLRSGEVLVNNFDLRQSKTIQWSGSSALRYDSDGMPYPGYLTAGLSSPDVESVTAVASLTSYTADLKWAPKGSAILVVPAPGVTASNPLYASLHEEFDDRDVFAFRTEDGRTVPAQPNSRDLLLAPVSQNGDDNAVSFIVPAGTTSGTVSMNLARARLKKELDGRGDKRATVSWVRAPAPFTLKVTLTP